jgi:hypothetical protein
MNPIEAQGSPKDRTKRVVSLPCGHQVCVEFDASLLAVSGPVLNHQATCRPERIPTFAAWFAVGPLSEGDPESLVERRVMTGALLG